jgi:hypothetical protein
VDIQHFRDPELKASKYSDGIIIVPDLTRASEYFEDEIQKRSILEEKAYLSGILFHLWLDYDFFASFLFYGIDFRQVARQSFLRRNPRVYKKGSGVFTRKLILKLIFI